MVWADIFSEDVVVRVILFESSSARESARFPTSVFNKVPNTPRRCGAEIPEER